MVYYIVAILIIIGHFLKRVAYAADFQGKIGTLAYNISTGTFAVAAVIAIWNMVNNYLLPGTGRPLKLIGSFHLHHCICHLRSGLLVEGTKETQGPQGCSRV